MNLSKTKLIKFKCKNNKINFLEGIYIILHLDFLFTKLIKNQKVEIF